MQIPLELPRPHPHPHPFPVPVPPSPGTGCPDCGAGLVRQSGCLVCVQCGWARCG